LPVVYNQYEFVTADAAYDPAHEHQQALLRPLYMTSFLIDDWLADNDLFGASQIMLSSASSKTSIGLAQLLSARSGIEVVGLTSAANAEFVSSLGWYDRTVVYGAVEVEPADVATVFVDMAGDGAVRSTVHHHFGDRLMASCQVGATHWEQVGTDGRLPGPRPSFFFAPDRVVKRGADWGPGGLDQRFATAWNEFVVASDSWLHVHESHGPEAVTEVFGEVLEGRARPDQGHILQL
jgi:hypothetical protein